MKQVPLHRWNSVWVATYVGAIALYVIVIYVHYDYVTYILAGYEKHGAWNAFLRIIWGGVILVLPVNEATTWITKKWTHWHQHELVVFADWKIKKYFPDYCVELAPPKRRNSEPALLLPPV